MRKFLLISLVLCMLLSVFAACDNGSQETEGTTTESIETSESESESKSESTSSESQSESESVELDEEQELLNKAEPALPNYDEDITYSTPDGYVLKQYNGEDVDNYYAAYKYYIEEGYTVYSKNEVGTSKSVTLVDGDAYAIVMYNANLEELYIGHSESGAEAFPEVLDTLGDDSVVPTITQQYSVDQNGMCYFIKLSDGSFIILDGGYDENTYLDNDGREQVLDTVKLTYDSLVKLNGSEDDIVIRAWLITHAHGDHYEMFDTFSKTYADEVTLERVMYSPIYKELDNGADVVGYDSYLGERVEAAADRFGAVLCPVHTGMSFSFGNIEFEILAAPEHIYKDNSDPADFNETSVVSRAVHKDGSMIFLGDCGLYVCNWMLDAYGEGLKSDMVQVAHHGGETANAEVYDAIQAHTLFWPCNEPLLNSERGLEVKQHILNAEYSKEHLLHSYGHITRPIDYKAKDTKFINLMPVSLTQNFWASDSVDNIRIDDDGVLRYEVKQGTNFDPHFRYSLKNIKTSECNAIRIVVSSNVLEGELYATPGELRYTAGSNKAHDFDAGVLDGKLQRLGITGASVDGKTTLIIYLGDAEDYTSKLTSLRWDFGTEVGQTVEIYSIEGFYVNVDAE